MNIEDLRNMYDNLVITNGEDYWKLIILEHLINNFEEKDKNIIKTLEKRKYDSCLNNRMVIVLSNTARADIIDAV